MSNQFTIEEATSLFGKTIECVKTRVWSAPEFDDKTDITFDLLKKGDEAKVDCIANSHGADGILISLLIDEDWLEFNKEQFQEHCVVVG